MRDRSLLIIAVCVSLVGLALLVVVRPDVSPQFIQLEGRVERVDVRGSVSFIRFSPQNFTAVSFSDVVFEEGDQTLIGRLQPYYGRVEFVVDSTRGIRVER